MRARDRPVETILRRYFTEKALEILITWIINIILISSVRKRCWFNI